MDLLFSWWTNWTFPMHRRQIDTRNVFQQCMETKVCPLKLMKHFQREKSKIYRRWWIPSVKNSSSRKNVTLFNSLVTIASENWKVLIAFSRTFSLIMRRAYSSMLMNHFFLLHISREHYACCAWKTKKAPAAEHKSDSTCREKWRTLLVHSNKQRKNSRNVLKPLSRTCTTVLEMCLVYPRKSSWMQSDLQTWKLD